MSGPAQRFVSELIRAANEVPALTLLERARLFQRASTAVLDQGGDPHLVHRLSEYGRLSDDATDEELSAWLLEAAEIIKGMK